MTTLRCGHSLVVKALFFFFLSWVFWGFLRREENEKPLFLFWYFLSRVSPPFEIPTPPFSLSLSKSEILELSFPLHHFFIVLPNYSTGFYHRRFIICCFSLGISSLFLVRWNCRDRVKFWRDCRIFGRGLGVGGVGRRLFVVVVDGGHWTVRRSNGARGCVVAVWISLYLVFLLHNFLFLCFSLYAFMATNVPCVEFFLPFMSIFFTILNEFLHIPHA